MSAQPPPFDGLLVLDLTQIYNGPYATFLLAKILRQTYGADRRLSYAGLAWYRGDAFEMDITLPRALVQESSPALIAPGMRSRK